ncbi:MAG: hypothetical protein EB036_14425, partial [Betaproteobacteria bacterium]|nr:hypothetical protein [Betaproteobacteria bacterium]
MKLALPAVWPKSALLTVLGGVLVLFSMTLLIPLSFALIFDEATPALFLKSMAACACCGLLLIALFRGSEREMLPRDGFMLVVLVWGV